MNIDKVPSFTNLVCFSSCLCLRTFLEPEFTKFESNDSLRQFSKLRDQRCSRLVSFSVFWLPSIKYENGLLLRNPCFLNSYTKQTCISFCNIQTFETLRSFELFWIKINRLKFDWRQPKHKKYLWSANYTGRVILKIGVTEKKITWERVGTSPIQPFPCSPSLLNKQETVYL